MSTSKRAWVTALVSGLITVAVKMGFIDVATAGVIATLILGWIGADTLRPSGTTGLMGNGGPIPPK